MSAWHAPAGRSSCNHSHQLIKHIMVTVFVFAWHRVKYLFSSGNAAGRILVTTSKSKNVCLQRRHCAIKTRETRPRPLPLLCSSSCHCATGETDPRPGHPLLFLELRRCCCCCFEPKTSSTTGTMSLACHKKETGQVRTATPKSKVHAPSNYSSTTLRRSGAY